MSKIFKAYAPASAANLSVGFDLLGAALKPIDGALLGDEITISENSGKGCDVAVVGRFATNCHLILKRTSCTMHI